MAKDIKRVAVTCPGCGNKQTAYKNNLETWQMLPHGTDANGICTGNNRRSRSVQEVVRSILDWDTARYGERNGRRIFVCGGKRKILKRQKPKVEDDG